MSNGEIFAIYITAERFTSLVYIDCWNRYKKDQEPDWNMGKSYELPVH